MLILKHTQTHTRCTDLWLKRCTWPAYVKRLQVPLLCVEPACGRIKRPQLFDEALQLREFSPLHCLVREVLQSVWVVERVEHFPVLCHQSHLDLLHLLCILFCKLTIYRYTINSFIHYRFRDLLIHSVVCWISESIFAYLWKELTFESAALSFALTFKHKQITNTYHSELSSAASLTVQGFVVLEGSNFCLISFVCIFS